MHTTERTQIYGAQTCGQSTNGHARRMVDELRSIIDTAHEAFVSIDEEGSITHWNPEAERTFGWAREEVLGRGLAETIIPEHSREVHHRGMRRFLETGKGTVLGTRLELTALHRDGHEFPVEVTISAVRQDGSWSFNAFLHDISERKRAEDALRRRELQLATAQSLARIGSWEWDIGRDEITWSDELYRIFGVDPREFGASFDAFIEAVHPDDRERVKSRIRQAMEDCSPFELEHRVARPDGMCPRFAVTVRLSAATQVHRSGWSGPVRT
jgi:PAS domain S-box-containing protein